jgi:hypothetical protein
VSGDSVSLLIYPFELNDPINVDAIIAIPRDIFRARGGINFGFMVSVVIVIVR